MFGANLAFGGQYFCKDSFVHNKGASHLPHMEWLAVTFLEAAFVSNDPLLRHPKKYGALQCNGLYR